MPWLNKELEILNYCKNNTLDVKCKCYNGDNYCYGECYPTYYLAAKRLALCGEDCKVEVDNIKLDGKGIVMVSNNCFTSFTNFFYKILDESFFSYQIQPLLSIKTILLLISFFIIITMLLNVK